MGDTSSSTLLSAYPQIAQQFPNNIACIFIRNTSATDSDDKLPYDTSDFKNVKNGTYFFYRVAEGECRSVLLSYFLICNVLTRTRRDGCTDLMDLDIPSGQCVNSSVPQNVSFGEQGGILDNAASASLVPMSWMSAAVAVAVVATTLGFF